MRPSTTGETLSVAHAHEIDALRRRYGHDTSSHAFNTLYIWRHYVGCQLHLEAELFSLCYDAKGPNTWLFPCGDEEAVCRFIQARLTEPDFALCYLREQDAQLLEKRFPGQFRLLPAPGDSEYVVDRDEHLALSGKRFEKLRNKVRRAEREHRIQVVPLTQDNAETALQVVAAWRSCRDTAGALGLYGDEGDAEPLKDLSRFGITGILLLVDGEPFGTAAAYRLSDDTWDLFLAKERTSDPVLGYVLRREMMRALPPVARFLNLEDDLDIEGLRMMKKQMIPVRMNEMWMAVRA